ncbi:UNVERIFIED_CONTAM: hypothetical protein FKN15_035406, partial [Acipenser sinensis]
FPVSPCPGSARATMTEFWQEHSEQATVEEMMLDSNARIISREEVPEILATLPALGGLRVLELGAGIGRYTQHLVKVASQVTAVDFMQKFLDKNKEDNSHHGNAEFIQADATQLDFPENRGTGGNRWNSTLLMEHGSSALVWGGMPALVQVCVCDSALCPCSFDLVFSNWLFMYLSDTELLSLAGRMLDWLSPGGYLFFRESCFHQSGTPSPPQQH